MLKDVRYNENIFDIKDEEFGNFGFSGRKKTGVPAEKPTEREPTTNSTHRFDFSELEPGPHWCVASALTTVSTFSLLEWLLIFLYAKGKFSPHILVLDRELPFHIIRRLFVLHYTCENATDKENKSTREK